MTCTFSMQAISAKTNLHSADVKRDSGGRNQNKLHVPEALMEYLLLGKLGS